MKNQEIKFNNQNSEYSILIGKNTINELPKKIKLLCPKAKNVALILDKKIPYKFKNVLKNKLKNYNLLILPFTANEKNKSINSVNRYLKILLSKNFNRSDLLIAVGGGITGDVAGFIASIFKRGINFINIPTTLLAQVDSAVGGKTGVNSVFGKNLIGSFYQPKLVISDTSFIKSLPRKEMVCGFAEILKHSIIKDKSFFNWLENNSNLILSKNSMALTYAIKKSCQIKIYFVKRDANEKNLRMKLNFGHTFAHAIEVKNNYSKKITHGEAVLTGMILAIKLSILKKNCKKDTLNKVINLYAKNNLIYTLKNISKFNWLKSLIPFLKNDKKNTDEKINFLLLKKIGQADNPNKFKISSNEFLKYCKTISQYQFLKREF
jgi:3-dehydroquinate synthase/shikimate kinase/3-dehydroquinate synthase